MQKLSERTVKCPNCKVRGFYLYENEAGDQELREAMADKSGGKIHTCPTAVQVEVQPISAEAPEAVKQELMKLVPPQTALSTYLPRKIDGGTDLSKLEDAYHLNVAHNSGKHLATCEKTCRGLAVNVLLISDTGAGKNHLGRALAAKLEIPYLRFPFNVSVTTDTLLGRPWMPEAAKTVWMDSRFTKLVRYGIPAIIFLDEVNAAPAEVTFVLHSALDDERRLIIDDNSEMLPIPAGILFVGAMNPDYAGTKPMNAAWKDRFSLVIPLEYETTIEKKLIGDDKLLKLAKALRDMHRKGDGTITSPVGTRKLLAYVQNRANFGEEIARKSFIAGFDTEDERRAIKEVMSYHLDKDAPIDVEKDINLD